MYKGLVDHLFFLHSNFVLIYCFPWCEAPLEPDSKEENYRNTEQRPPSEHLHYFYSSSLIQHYSGKHLTPVIFFFGICFSSAVSDRSDVRAAHGAELHDPFAS